MLQQIILMQSINRSTTTTKERKVFHKGQKWRKKQKTEKDK